MNRYRPDIDGLRAIAILPVLLFHAGATGFSGGFVGVDVFFVISGYLITGIIVREIAAERFSLPRFYLRRAKRILPALCCVLGGVFCLALLLFTPSELRNLGKMTAATAAFVSNIMLWRERGYFDVTAEQKPLLMTWSLGIEEQFYICWPLVLLLASKWRGASRVIATLAAAMSFGLACWGVAKGADSSFYLLPARAWELLVGAALVLGGPQGEQPCPASRRRNVGSIVGLMLIGCAVLLLDRHAAFPGWNAVLPCAGAMLLIWAGENAAANRYLLSSRPLVFVGAVSYSLYLWHWPLLSIGRLVIGPELPIAWTAGILALTGLLSVLTWHFVEVPARRAQAVGVVVPLARYGLLTSLVFSVGAFTYVAGGFPRRVSPEILKADAARRDHNPLRGACLKELESGGGLSGAECVSRRVGQPIVALWGDSHADAIAPGVRTWADHHGYGFSQLTATSCPPLPAAEIVLGGSVSSGCSLFNQHVTEGIVADRQIEVVFLVARWAVYTENSRFGEDPGPIPYLIDAADKDLCTSASKRVFERSLADVVSVLTRAEKAIVLVGQTPEMGLDVPSCQERRARLAWLGISPQEGPSCSVDASLVAKRVAFTNAVISKEALPNQSVRAFFPTDVLCGVGVCKSEIGGAILYSDDDHLSATGAQYVSEHFDSASVGFTIVRRAPPTKPKGG